MDQREMLAREFHLFMRGDDLHCGTTQDFFRYAGSVSRDLNRTLGEIIENARDDVSGFTD
jgi:hypothetical protein